MNRGKEIMKKQSVLPSIVLIVVLVICVPGLQIWNGRSAEAQGTSLNVINPLTGDNSFNFTDAEKNVGDTFVVNITVVDVTNLSGWQIGLSWDASLLDFVSFELPPDNVFAGQSTVNASSITSGYGVFGVALPFSEENSFNGTGTLCQITLKIIKSLSPPLLEVSCNLAFAGIGTDTFLLNQLNDIPFSAFNGVYDYKHLPGGTTYLEIVNPLTGDGWFDFTTLQKNVGDTFIVNITVVNAVWLNFWQIKFTWDPSLLAFVSAEIPSDNVFAGKNPLAVGALETGDCLIGALLPNATSFFSGNGTLCQITLSLISSPSKLAPEVSCDLGFANIDYDTFLGGPGMANIQFVASEGSYNYAYALIHDVAITNTTPAKTVIGQGYSANINVTVANPGDYTETFNVTAYANATSIGTQEVIALTSGNSTQLVFTWNTTGFAYGNYTLSATADTVPGETNTSNNNFTCPFPVHVGVPGDISSSVAGVYDKKCDMKDIAYLVILFNTKPASPNWNPNADVDNNSVVNMIDIAIAILNFNKHE
jgi:hypothetical protein